jgi:hypothetical protein
MAGIATLHELIGQHVGQDDGELDDPAQVVVGIETDRGPWVQALLAAGYQVFAINPLSVARYRERHTTSGARSDPGVPPDRRRARRPSVPSPSSRHRYQLPWAASDSQGQPAPHDAACRRPCTRTAGTCDQPRPWSC